MLLDALFPINFNCVENCWEIWKDGRDKRWETTYKKIDQLHFTNQLDDVNHYTLLSEIVDACLLQRPQHQASQYEAKSATCRRKYNNRIRVGKGAERWMIRHWKKIKSNEPLFSFSFLFGMQLVLLTGNNSNNSQHNIIVHQVKSSNIIFKQFSHPFLWTVDAKVTPTVK